MRAVFFASLTLILASTTSAKAIDISSCGTTVPKGETGVLQTDLDCSNDLFGVRLLRKATLDLNGHAISGGTVTFATVLGANRVNPDDPTEGGRGNFTIVGPGEISGVLVSPVFAVGTQGCVVLQNGRARITSPTGVVDIHGCVFGVVGYLPEYSTNVSHATIDHVILRDNLFEGVTVRRLLASNVLSHDNGGIGVHAIVAMQITDVVAVSNPIGIFAVRSVKGANVTATGNGNGVESFGAIDLTNLDASNNSYLFGVNAPRVRLVDSIVTGNALADIGSRRKPRLVNTVCGLSAGSDGAPWGVCAND